MGATLKFKMLNTTDVSERHYVASAETILAYYVFRRTLAQRAETLLKRHLLVQVQQTSVDHVTMDYNRGYPLIYQKASTHFQQHQPLQQQAPVSMCPV